MNKGETGMEISMKRRLRGAIVAATVLTVVLATGAVAPVQAAERSTVTMLSSGDIFSLNSGTSDGNTSYNAISNSLTGMGFTYYNSDTQLVMNTAFGTMKIVKQDPKDFQIEYTVTKGQQWSDGTPIDAVDLLLSHVVAANKYSIDAGLGDPSDSNSKPAFDSVAYSSSYGEHVVGLPKLSAGNMTLTVKFDKPLPDWELLAPGPFPVHALSLMADGKKGLQSAAVNKAAKAKFLGDFKKKATARLKKMGEIWTKGYDVTSVDSSTNPLLLISNGGFIVSKFTYGDSMTLVRNPNYSSGPKMKTKKPIKTVVIKIIKDNTASVQALRNGDIDVYFNTLPTANDRLTLEAMPNVTTLVKTGGNYSHFDLRTDSAHGESDSYTGPFAGNGLRAKDLRKAMLLALPRQQMVDTLIKPVKADAAPMDTQFAFPGTSEYNTITKGSGVLQFSEGTQAERSAKALAIVQKYYPSATATNPGLTIKFAHADTKLRNSLAALIKAEAKNAGFNVETTAFKDLFGEKGNKSGKYDMLMYGFGLTAISQQNALGIYKSDGTNNAFGWRDSALDALAAKLEGEILTPAQVTATRLAMDKIIISNYWGLPLYANPTIAAWNKALKGIDPAPIGNTITWNFFDWSY
jgi:peptide/nickel transport system substrate-binding protein